MTKLSRQKVVEYLERFEVIATSLYGQHDEASQIVKIYAEGIKEAVLNGSLDADELTPEEWYAHRAQGIQKPESKDE